MTANRNGSGSNRDRGSGGLDEVLDRARLEAAWHALAPPPGFADRVLASCGESSSPAVVRRLPRATVPRPRAAALHPAAGAPRSPAALPPAGVAASGARSRRRSFLVLAAALGAALVLLPLVLHRAPALRGDDVASAGIRPGGMNRVDRGTQFEPDLGVSEQD